jgi:hypothetical protein
MSEANDFLMAGGVPSAKFPTVGTSVTGTIVRQPELRQQTDITSGKPKFWDDGSPRQQVVVTLATNERDATLTDDDGERAVYVKGNLTKAVREAVRTSGAKGLEVGGTLTVTFVGEGQAERGMNAPKLYSASYVPAPAVAAANFLAADEPEQAAPPAPAPAMAGAPAAAPAGVDPAALAALQNLTPEQRATLGL